jgi:DNA invertase Pin-like site-specific DNA recombinase
VSAVATCTQLEASIDMLRTGDKLVVTKLDRLARSVVLTPLVVPPPRID